MNLTYSLIAVIVLLAANAFFVAAEFALVKARGFRITALAKQGSKSAKLTVKIQANLEEYLAACQLGITMASLGLGWVGEPAVAHLLEPLFVKFGASDAVVHSASFLIGFLIFSSLHIVVGEQVPKTYAIRKPEPVSMWCAYPLRFAFIAVWPLNWLLNKASGGLLGMFGVEPAGHDEVLTGDELKGLVATSSKHGELEREHADMIHNLFEFDQRQVGRVMIPRNSMHCLQLNGDPQKNFEIIRDTEHSRFPVIDSEESGAIAGILVVKDIHRALLDGEPQPWLDIKRFCREPLVVPEAQKVPELFELMRSKRAHMAFVVDEYGTFVGAVTLEDLLEEIVGEIEDETDDLETAIPIAQTGPDTWVADGLLSLGDLTKATGMRVDPMLDANTLSGLLMERLARMPEPGDELQEGKFLLIVDRLEDSRVGQCTIHRMDPGAPKPSLPADSASEEAPPAP